MLGLLKRVLYHLLQVSPIARSLRELVAMLLELTHVEQQRSHRPGELTRYLCSGLIHCPCARRGQSDNFNIVGGPAAFQPVRELRITGFLLRHAISLMVRPSSRVNFLLSKTTDISADLQR